MPLSSSHFAGEGVDAAVRKRLDDCSKTHSWNIHGGRSKGEPGLKGAVSLIQDALRILDEKVKITDDDGVYGPSTAAAVNKFKREHKPKPILGPGQTVPDSVVGIQTIAALDEAMGGLPKPVKDQFFQDFVIRVLGFDPKDKAAGQQTTAKQEAERTDGQFAIRVPSVAVLRSLINTPEYLKLHKPAVILNFNGGGGRANPASDPTSSVLAALKAERKKASDAKFELGKIVVYGWSIGGRGAANIARAIKADTDINQSVDFLGLIDAAWDDDKDSARTAPVNVLAGVSIYESATNELVPKGFEFHGVCKGTADNDLHQPNTFWSLQLAGWKAGSLNDDAFFNMSHKAAVEVGHKRVQARVLNLLGSV